MPGGPPLSIASMGAAVLAGGRGSRFGGDKAFAPFRGTTLLGHLVSQLHALGFAQLIVSGKDLRRHREMLLQAADPPLADLTFIADESRETALGAGERIDSNSETSFNPLLGLRAALRASRHSWLFVCATDMPFAADRRLIEALAEVAPGEAAVAPIHQGQPQPLCALWNRERALGAAETLLREGSGGPRKLLERLGARQLDWSDPRPFLDADTREALALLEKQA